MSDICAKIGIPDVNRVMVPKVDIKKAIFEDHYRDMIEEVKSKAKLDPIKDEDFTELQEYFNEKSIANSRMSFKIRSQMVSDIPGNFKNRYRKKGTEKEGLVCEYCQEDEIMTQIHCLSCPAWASLRQDLDLADIKDLVTYFRKMMDERDRVSREAASHDSSAGSSSNS